MQITSHGLWAMIHGLGFGGLYLLAFSGALVELYRSTAPAVAYPPSPARGRFLNVYLILMVVLAWLAVVSGAYIVYPWYRTAAPPGTIDLSLYPQRLLMANPTTSGWHSLGMEWKEHVAWLAPISITMVAFVFIRYGNELRNHVQLRRAVLGFAWVAFLAAALAGFLGAVIDKQAPVKGGATIQLTQGGER
jgi:hypothetical protein